MKSQNTLQFRKAAIWDAEKITRLVNSAYRGDSSKQGWTTEAHFLDGQRADADMIEGLIQTQDKWILLAEMQGKLVGSIVVEKIDSETSGFGMFAIDPTLQAQGVGRALLEEAERFGRDDLKCKIMEMTVITIRKELIAWYERRGYKKTGETRPFPSNSRFGIPLREDLALGVFSKRLF